MHILTEPRTHLLPLLLLACWPGCSADDGGRADAGAAPETDVDPPGLDGPRTDASDQGVTTDGATDATPDLPASPAVDWDRWTRRPECLWVGNWFEEYAVGWAADPSVRQVGEQLEMFYTCTGFHPDSPEIAGGLCKAVSTDGCTWDEFDEPSRAEPLFPGFVLGPRPGAWDHWIETASIQSTPGGDLLYYTGYRGVPDPRIPDFGHLGAGIGLAVSGDGEHFERHGDGQVLAPTPGGFDHDALISPYVIEKEGGGYAMVYAGYCLPREADPSQGLEEVRCGRDSPSIAILLAESEDGLTWAKHPEPLLEADPATDPGEYGVAEPALLRDPSTGTYHLFFTSVGERRLYLGLASAPDLEGPYQRRPDPILEPAPAAYPTLGAGNFEPDMVIAPAVLYREGRGLMWFIENDRAQDLWYVGFAEAAMVGDP